MLIVIADCFYSLITRDENKFISDPKKCQIRQVSLYL